LVRQLTTGKIDEATFAKRFAYVLNVGHDRALSLGWSHGLGAERLSQEAETYLAETITQEANFARELAQELASGEKSAAQGNLAAKRYAQRMGGTANEAFRLAGIGGGYTIKWILGGAEQHCPECPEYAAMDWTPEDLFTVPRGGQTTCRLNCLCHLERSDGRVGFTPVSFE
jgi:hypothetical protein